MLDFYLSVEHLIDLFCKNIAKKKNVQKTKKGLLFREICGDVIFQRVCDEMSKVQRFLQSRCKVVWGHQAWLQYAR